MPNLIPVAPLELDPRNQGQIVEAAATQIFTASGGLINNFSAGSPALCLLEGQAFTNAEFLYWLNKLPNAFLATWLQHYCGIQRKTNGFAIVELTFTLSRQLSRPFLVFQNYRVRVPNLINQNNVSFVTQEELVIPAGSLTGSVLARCEDSGTVGNVAANTITQPESNLAFLQSVTNLASSSGGLDAETETETVSRAFFHTLSYRNPVSESDWVGVIKARLGLDTEVIVSRDKEAFIYYFYLLRSSPIPSLQLESLRLFLKQKTILGYDIVVENFKNQFIDIYLDVTDSQNSTSGSEILNFAKDSFRFRSQDKIQGIDLAALFAERFSYLDPNLESIEVYSTNTNSPSFSTTVSTQSFRYLVNDLFWDGVNYYAVLNNFNSVGDTFLDFVSDPILKTDFKLATLGFSIGTKIGGEVILESGNYYLVPATGYYNSVSELTLLVQGIYTAGDDLEQGKVYVDSGTNNLYCYIPQVNVPTQPNLTNLANCQAEGVVGSAFVSINSGTPTVSSGYTQSNDIIYYNLDVANVHDVSMLGTGHKYKSRYRAGQIILENNQYKYVYQDHSPHTNLGNNSIKSVVTSSVNNPVLNFVEDFIKDTDGVIYSTNVSNSDDSFLIDKESAGYFTRYSVFYPAESKVIKEGVEYSYQLRRAVVRYNGVISQSLQGILTPNTTYIDYKNRY